MINFNLYFVGKLLRVKTFACRLAKRPSEGETSRVIVLHEFSNDVQKRERERERKAHNSMA